MGTIKNMNGVFLEVDYGFSRGNGLGYIFCKELGNVTVEKNVYPDPVGKWFRFDCYWDPTAPVIESNECGSTQIGRTDGCFVAASEVQNVKAELGNEKECRDNGRIIAKFSGSGLVLEVYPNFMYLWHCHVGVILHVKGENAKKDLNEIFVPLQPISFKAVAINCPNRFVAFSVSEPVF
ncbi:unnamed protein product [Auanema sp. JU1783]|nr:unnamed protein product [Auanema sp. JU1783]